MGNAILTGRPGILPSGGGYNYTLLTHLRRPTFVYTENSGNLSNTSMTSSSPEFKEIMDSENPYQMVVMVMTYDIDFSAITGITNTRYMVICLGDNYNNISQISINGGYGPSSTYSLHKTGTMYFVGYLSGVGYGYSEDDNYIYYRFAEASMGQINIRLYARAARVDVNTSEVDVYGINLV